VLVGHFGEAGRHLGQLARGQDDRDVAPDQQAKSISTETTFAHDIADRHVLRRWLLDLVDHLGTRLRHAGVRARSIELKLRSSDFRTRTRSQSLADATDVTNVLWQAAQGLFERSLTPELLPIRLLGVGAAKLTRDTVVQHDLFEDRTRQRQSALDRVVDAIRGQFGTDAIRRGSLVERPGPEDEEPSSG